MNSSAIRRTGLKDTVCCTKKVYLIKPQTTLAPPPPTVQADRHSCRLQHESEGAALHVSHLETGGSNSRYGLTVSSDGERQEVAEMALAVRTFVFCDIGRIIMPACRKARDHLSILHSSCAIRVLMNVKSMNTWGQVDEFGREHESCQSFADRDRADAFADALLGQEVHLNHHSAANTGSATKTPKATTAINNTLLMECETANKMPVAVVVAILCNIQCLIS